MDYFEFYNIPQSFSPDEKLIRRNYLLNSRKFHPDFHTRSDTAQQDNMLELASLNNEAFRTLLDHDLRIQYLLRLRNAMPEEGNTAPLPQSFLLEMMDLNEGVMDLEFDNDAGKLANLSAKVTQYLTSLDNETAPLLQTWTPENPQSAQQLEQIKNYYFKRKYLLRIQENLLNFASAFDE